MLCTMLCLVLLVFTLTGRCGGDSDNSSSSPMPPLPPAPAARRMSAAQVHSLRRQLMRDNYDYQHSADERQPNITARSGGDTKFYDQKGGTDHVSRASELAQENSNEFSLNSSQQEHYKQRDQLEQPGEHEQGRQHNQNGEYEHRDQHTQRGKHEQDRHHNQPGEYEHRDQYEQPGEHKQRGQFEQHDQYDQHGPRNQHGKRKHYGHYQEREQLEQRGQNEQRGSHEQHGENEQSEQQAQLGQFDEQEQAQSIEQTPRTAPSLGDAPGAPPVATPFTNELPVRDVFERQYTPDRRHIEPDQAKKHNPSYYNKQRDAYNSPYPAQMQRRPFSDLRGNYKEQYGQNDDMRAQEELASNAQESLEQEYTPDEQDAFDQQDASGSQDDEESKFSESKKRSKIYNEFVMRSTTRANRLQYYTPAPAERNAPPHRVHNLLSYHDHNSPLSRSHNAPSPHRNAPPPHQNAPPPHRNSPDHNISKKDLLYYMDDNQLRRRNNDASPDALDEDQLPSPQPRTRARRPAPPEGRSGGKLPQTSRARRSFVVTVSAANVTYKLLTLKSRSGRRQDERRILEERGPTGVAIMSLDHAPLPAFRLPRARRQYMHAPHHHRRHEPA